MVLSGWKDISRYLGCGIRTAQRWETSGLPVRRPVPGRRSHVVAFSEQLDAWIHQGDERWKSSTKALATINRSHELYANFQRSAMHFLRAEIHIGLGLAKISLGANSSEKRERNRTNARKAYDAILRFRRDEELSSGDRAEIEAGLAKLRSALKSLGEKIEE